MISSVKSNIYEVNAISTLAVYGDFIEGTPQQTALTISTRALGQAGRDAASKSMRALGFGDAGCAWVWLAEGDGSEIALGAADLMSIVEGLDPLGIIVADKDAATLLGQAYRCTLPADDASRVMGRNVASFSNLEAMLGEEAGKQKAWAIMKKAFR